MPLPNAKMQYHQGRVFFAFSTQLIKSVAMAATINSDFD